MVFKYHIKEIILSFLLIFMLFVNIVLVFDKLYLSLVLNHPTFAPRFKQYKIIYAMKNKLFYLIGVAHLLSYISK